MFVYFFVRYRTALKTICLAEMHSNLGSWAVRSAYVNAVFDKGAIQCPVARAEIQNRGPDTLSMLHKITEYSFLTCGASCRADIHSYLIIFPATQTLIVV